MTARTCPLFARSGALATALVGQAALAMAGPLASSPPQASIENLGLGAPSISRPVISDDGDVVLIARDGPPAVRWTKHGGIARLDLE